VALLLFVQSDREPRSSDTLLVAQKQLRF